MMLSVGLNCLDIINFVNKYPEEDDDIRCTTQTWERGGNASNNATVLACLGQKVEFLGPFANDHLLKFFQNDMDSYGIRHQNCPIIKGVSKAPASVVICSEETGSMTIVHSRGLLPELTLDNFTTKINLNDYSWVHFEGRSDNEVSQMMQFINEFNAKNPKTTNVSLGSPDLAYKNVHLPISVEVEKRRDSIGIMIPFAHVVFVGKDFALLQGATDCLEAAKIISEKAQPGTLIVCPWGDQGAAYCIAAGGGDMEIKKIDAFKPSKIIDSLGAGDVFVATTVCCLNKGLDIETSVRLGCKIASEKLAMYGFKGIKDVASKIPQLSP